MVNDMADEKTVEDISSKLFEDPAAFLDNFRQSIKKEVFEQVAGAYQREQTSNDYWGGFFTQRPDLKEHKGEAREHLAGREEAWRSEGLTVGESYNRLAEEIDEARTIRDAKRRAGSMGVTDTDGNSHTYGGQVHARIRGKDVIVKSDGSHQPTLTQTILDRQAKFTNPRAAKEGNK